ncbi:hypothetical protein PIB30_090258, partial [Stylosanthes scabra]|nr:hypothetical protein [Stylosanthes scabra]
WLAKEKALQGNHPQGLVAHLPAAKPHKKLRANPYDSQQSDKCIGSSSTTDRLPAAALAIGSEFLNC